ncbi:LTA synthase family protein [Kordiimonas marina]|uniref:LTA synthase family protein n=1 Tax=Kordiimonas marina TaxID=2872312 RepID=UPI001FF5E123|nr:LTA synthase family protein [Kordiimonas marina]MCJ9428717.1 LTA synthase family protein [Kordiimonas marina]
MITLLAAVILLLPYALEAMVKIGFTKRPRVRSPLFYVLTPLASVLTYVSFAALLGHPYIAFFGWMLIIPGFAFISNVKNAILGEPLTAPDLDTTRHLFIYPEFYVDYVGRWRFYGTMMAFAAAIVASYFLEPSFASLLLPTLPGAQAWAFMLLDWAAFLFIIAKLAAAYLSEDRARKLGVTFDVNTDVARFGLFPLMLIYGVLLLSNANKSHLHKDRKLKAGADRLPDIIALQAESYFDLGRLDRLVEGAADDWPTLKALEGKGIAHGPLTVPAWGACTMQSEFAFLSGIPNEHLGIDRINPYLRMANTPLPTLASQLKALGYRTICVHPAKKEFFRRHKVVPMMGFDEFVGLEAFDERDRLGPYISDAALGTKIEEIIAEHHKASDVPLFVFVITIESHGPWQAGRLAGWLDEDALKAEEPSGDHAFALYRHHMENALALFSRLGPDAAPARPRAMALYGDHQPALYELFSAHGLEERDVNYILWSSETRIAPHGALKVETLADALLKAADIQ